jgi:NAD(P)-dependent dehydrogenase (short-subunit alcohol dehydrogenase family)
MAEQALVVGTGAIGAAIAAELAREGFSVVARGRRTDPPLDLLDEATIAAALAGLAPRVVVVASGYLHGAWMPERRLREIEPAHMAHAFAINAIGPALIMKHAMNWMPRQGRAVFAVLSARVGSIGDNRLGGWLAYRASKAALNQALRTAAIEFHRHNQEAVCLALHPGTVASPLSAPFAKAGLTVRPPGEAAAALVRVMLGAGTPGEARFLDYAGAEISW